MKHIDLRNQSVGEPPLLSRLPTQPSATAVQAQGGWLVEDDVNKGHLNNRSSGLIKESDALRSDRQRAHQNSSSYTTPVPAAPSLFSQTSEVKSEEVVQVFSTLFLNHLPFFPFLFCFFPHQFFVVTLQNTFCIC